MASQTRVPKVEITGIFGYLLKKMTRKMLGEVPESVGVMWNYPAVFQDMMGFGRKIAKWNRLDRNLASFAHMAAASLIGCSFCLDLNYFMAHNKGLDEDKAREVPRWRESGAFTSLERRVMEYAEAMSQTPPTVTDEMSAALLKDLGAPALIELTARIAFMNSSARVNIALGIESQEYSAACGLKPLASPLQRSGRSRTGRASTWPHGARAARIEPVGEIKPVITFAIEDGLIARIYVIVNPHKLGRLEEVTELSRTVRTGLRS